MPKASPVITNLTAGELSQWLRGRFDISKYPNGAKEIENFLVHQAGGAQFRPGTKYVSEVKTSSAKTRLITFEFSTTQTYIIELGNLYMRFYRNQGQILGNGSAYELTTPYLTADLFDLQFAQDADTMFIVHPSYKPRELTRTGHAAWTLKNYAPELLTLDVAPGGAGWSAGDTITGQTSGKTSIIVEVLTTTTYRIKNRDGAYTLGEVLTNGTATADQGAAHPTTTGDPFGADASDDCPSCVAMFEQRIKFANTNNNPQQIWASVSGDFQDMTVGTDAGDAFTYVIASDKVNAIRWLKPTAKSVQIGTLGGTFSMSSGSDALAITPTNVTVKRDTTYGCANIMPEVIGNFLYYVERDLVHLRELGYSIDRDAQRALDMTILSDHIGNAEDPTDTDGFTQVAYQQSPVSRLWCVRNDGQLAVLTRQIDQEVIGWSRQVAGADSRAAGEFESVAIIPTDEGDDEIWVIVKRYINGSTVRYIEYFMPERFDNQQDAFFVDSALSLDSPKTITGITLKTEIDDMEYASDVAAQDAYVSSDTEVESFTKLLLHCNGADGSTTFIDEIGKTITSNGLAQLDTAQQKFGSASGLFNGSTGYLSTADHADWDFGSGDFTLDFWVRFNSVKNSHFFAHWLAAGNQRGWNFYLGGGGTSLVFSYSITGSDEYQKSVSWTPSANTWYHVALVRNGNNLYFFVNGTQQGSTQDVTGVDIYDSTRQLEIGGSATTGFYTDGWLDEIRISKGAARWTANFTPESSEYSETLNLQCYSESTIKQQGDYSLKAIAAITNSLNDTLTRTLSTTVDLSGVDSIVFKVYASRTGSNLKIGFHDSGGITTEHTVNITAANTWQTETVDISDVADANKDVINSIIITILNADAENTFYIDNVHSPAGLITVTSTAHGFVDDDEIRIVDVVGMTELNNLSFVVDKLTDNTFALKDSGGAYVDGADYTAYISGGEARKKATTITGLTHLVGEEVDILADGVVVESKIVNASGEVTLDASAALVHAGLGYTGNLKLLPQPAGSATGLAIGKKQKISKLIIKLYDSIDFKYGPDEDTLDTLTFLPSSLFTGDKVVSFPGDWDRSGDCMIQQDQPLPLNILSVTLITEVVDD